MKKKLNIFLTSAVLFILCAITVIGFTGCGKIGISKDTTIALMSDVHVSSGEDDNSKKFIHAMESMYKQSADLDALVIAGDMTDNGKNSEYGYFMKLLEENKKDATTLITCMGNHEFYQDGWGGDVLANGMTKPLQERYESYTGGKVEDDIVVNGIHFISVSPDNEMDLYHTREAYLKEHIAAAAKEDPYKPIFLVSHKPAGHTSISSFDRTAGSTHFLAADWSEDFLNFLKDYPQIINVVGHSHDSIRDPLAIHQKDYTTINCGGVQNGISCALFATITTDYVVTIQRMNLTQDMMYTEPWVIDMKKVVDNKENFTYTEDRIDRSAKPVFESDKIEVLSEEEKSITIKYPKATATNEEDGGLVQSYLFRVFNNDTGKYMSSNELNEGFDFSYYRVYVDPDVIGEPVCDYTKKFDRLKSGVSYTIEISAINPFYKESDILKYTFTKK